MTRRVWQANWLTNSLVGLRSKTSPLGGLSVLPRGSLCWEIVSEKDISRFCIAKTIIYICLTFGEWREKSRKSEARDVTPGGFSQLPIYTVRQSYSAQDMEKTIGAIRSLDPFCREYVTGCLEGRSLDEIFARLSDSLPELTRPEFDRRVIDCRRQLLASLATNQNPPLP